MSELISTLCECKALAEREAEIEKLEAEILRLHRLAPAPTKCTSPTNFQTRTTSRPPRRLHAQGRGRCPAQASRRDRTARER